MTEGRKDYVANYLSAEIEITQLKLDVRDLRDALATSRELREYDRREIQQLRGELKITKIFNETQADRIAKLEAMIAHVRARSVPAAEILNEFENTPLPGVK